MIMFFDWKFDEHFATFVHFDSEICYAPPAIVAICEAETKVFYFHFQDFWLKNW